jgi:enterochelin esterase-like enzyme
MKKQFLLFILVSFSTLLSAQTGKVLDDLSMQSEILNMDRKYAVYLPPDYDISKRSYPVLYLLHGGGDNQTAWIQFGEVMHITDKAIKEGMATSMIIIMPDASAGRRGYFNSMDGDWRYEDFFFEEFIPYIERTYRIKSEKRYRAVAGLSMGGGGTFIYALHHPELFSSACPLSANCGPVSLDDNQKFRWTWPRGPNSERKEFTREEKEIFFTGRSVLYMIKNMPEEQKKEIRWYIDCGDDDQLFYDSNSLIHIAMRDNEIPHEYRVRDGGHNWQYWREALPEVLRFISKTFRQH